MCAVNDPNVVLGAAETRFVAPVAVGDRLVATARRAEVSKRKHVVEVSCAVGDREVMTGSFTCFVLEQHVLEKSEGSAGSGREPPADPDNER
jgi:acyl-coenzyme A thioesterase PaaI-like protein